MSNARELAELGGAYSTGGYPHFKNRIINGAMMIDQRNAGASVTIPAAVTYTLDRWFGYGSQASKFSIQQNAGSVTPPSGFINYLGATSLSAYSVSSGDAFVIQQRIEGLNCADLGWGAVGASPVTLSFWVRSSLTGTFGGAVRNSADSRAYPFSFVVNASNTWEQKTITIAGDTTGTWLTTNGVGMKISFCLGAGSTYQGTANTWSSTAYETVTGAISVVGTNGATFYITGVQLEKGSTATSYDYRPYGTELALCQRYYQTFPALITVSGSNGRVPVPNPQVSMRTTPAITSSSIFNTESGSTTIASPTYGGISPNGSAYTSQTSAGSGVMSTINSLTWSAEL